MRLSDLQSKDIINTKDGKRVGRIIDAEINLDEGKVLYLIVEPRQLIRNILRSGGEATIQFNQINKIGEDVILVDL